MRLIVGLGNPGNEYLKTRHNLGYSVVDKYVNSVGIEWSNFGKIADVGRVNDEWIVKPMLYMNRSGEALAELIRYYKIENFELVLVHDDLDILDGKIKIQKSGGSAGHNGVKSILSCLSEWRVEEDWRIRLGIKSLIDCAVDATSYVLEKLNNQELVTYGEMTDRAVELLLARRGNDWGKLMNSNN